MSPAQGERAAHTKAGVEAGGRESISIFGKGRAPEEPLAACVSAQPQGEWRRLQGTHGVCLVHKQLSLGSFPALCSPPEVSACLASWEGGVSAPTACSPVWACGRGGEKFQEKKQPECICLNQITLV